MNILALQLQKWDSLPCLSLSCTHPTDFHLLHYHEMKTSSYYPFIKEHLELCGEAINEQWWNMLHHILTV